MAGDIEITEGAASDSQHPIAVTHWGAYRVVVADGKPVKLLGFDDDPAPSPIGNAMLDTLEGPCRIGKPMVRRGFLDHGPGGDRSLRGRDAFVAVEWDEALDLVARELNRVRDDWGNEAIYAGSYGWASAGRFHHAQSQLRRFMNLFGGCSKSRDSYSYAAAEVILPHVVGPMQKLLIEHTSWRSIAEGAGLVVAFGGMALRNTQVNSGGTGCHSQQQDMLAARQAGVEFVNVSPAASDTMSELQAEWFPIRPNTDVAMMLALAHTLVSEDLHDKAFLDRYCTGFDDFVPYLMGTKDGTPKTASWAEKITGIPAAAIVALARRMAATPTMVCASWSLTRQQHGEQPFWMLVVLAAMLGGIGQTGTGFALGLGAVNGIGNNRSHLPWAALPTGQNSIESFIPVARIADMLLHPGEAFQYNGQNLQYPDVRLVYWVGGNPFHHHQDLNRLRRAWQRIETVVVHEPFWTPIARHADIVLPATVSLERNDLSGSPRDSYMMAMRQVAEPYRDACNDHDIFAALAERLRGEGCSEVGFRDAFTEGRNEEEWLRELYRETRARGRQLGHELPEFDAFLEQGVIRLESPAEAQVLLKAFRNDPEAHPLTTPSGRIEIFSKTIAGFELDNNPGHPVWCEPQEWLGADLARQFPLHLISHQPPQRLHSQLDHSAHSRAGKVKGREPCRLNPADAARRQIAEGDFVRLFNKRGACLSVAQIDPDLRQGVVSIATGAWYDPDWDRDPDCCKHGNPNVLTADLPTSPLAQGPGAMTCLVEVERWHGNAPEVTAFVPPSITF
ncbi:molybdopterin-dependent oxidoreductase [Pelagibius sp. Alg239-R121]|uniref:molybdopterin-dependent oxidoreductase n=1 Tax=Pelagibius sp. Alg239-R121 TaxID=2993448 RepID=UPI0024A729ED|nr:molybdopterin-dependent oxidoreductase [Pelagibius sp. Alg239-R121]